MDEATTTASIDIQTDVMIQEMVRKNFGSCAVLTIAHRLNSIMDSGWVMVFDAGRLMEMETLIDAGTTTFNSLVEQSGCAGELHRLGRSSGRCSRGSGTTRCRTQSLRSRSGERKLLELMVFGSK